MRKDRQKILCGILIGLNLCLIWGNSLLPGQASDSVSGWLQAFLSFLPDSELAHTLLRKAAHFSEFALLGLLMGWMAVLTRRAPNVSLLGLGLGTGCVDETIQLFVPGRASSILDVWIDFSGFAAGLLILTLGYLNYEENCTDPGSGSEPVRPDCLRRQQRNHRHRSRRHCRRAGEQGLRECHCGAAPDEHAH